MVVWRAGLPALRQSNWAVGARLWIELEVLEAPLWALPLPAVVVERWAKRVVSRSTYSFGSE